jgi:hypothetical protein
MQNLGTLLLLRYLRFRNSKRLGTVTVRRQRSTSSVRRIAPSWESLMRCALCRWALFFGDPEPSKGGKMLHSIACLTHTHTETIPSVETIHSVLIPFCDKNESSQWVIRSSHDRGYEMYTPIECDAVFLYNFTEVSEDDLPPSSRSKSNPSKQPAF